MPFCCASFVYLLRDKFVFRVRFSPMMPLNRFQLHLEGVPIMKQSVFLFAILLTIVFSYFAKGNEPTAGKSRLEYIDSVYAQMPPVEFEFTQDRWQCIPKTIEKLQKGGASHCSTRRQHHGGYTQFLYEPLARTGLSKMQGGMDTFQSWFDRLLVLSRRKPCRGVRSPA